MSATLDTCALCPRLCRHVCPVAVGTGLESATPTAILTEAMIAQRPEEIPHEAHHALDLCTRCGHCADFCGVDQPVVDLLDTARTRHQPRPKPWQAPPIQGHCPTVAIICDAKDWSDGLAEDTHQPLARLLTPDHLGETHRIRTDTLPDVIAQLKTLFQGRTAITSCGTCRQALTDADVTVESIVSVSQFIPPLPTWRSCHCVDGPSVDTNIRCCGARAPLIGAMPHLATMMATEIRRRLDGQAIFVPDTRCAAHLQSVGINAVGPADHFKNPER